MLIFCKNKLPRENAKNVKCWWCWKKIVCFTSLIMTMNSDVTDVSYFSFNFVVSRYNGNERTFLLKSGQLVPSVFQIFLVTHSSHLFLPATGWEMERGRGKKWKMSIKRDRITTRGLFRHTFYDKGANRRTKKPC